MLAETSDGNTLSEVALSKDRSVESLLEELEEGKPSLKRRASRHSQERLERQKQELLNQAGKKIDREDIRKQVEEQIKELDYAPEEEINEHDIESSLNDFVEQGDMEWEDEEIKMTSRGARKLGSYLLSTILKKLTAREFGAHHSHREDHGSQLATSARKYELGDEYHRIDFENTLLNAIQRDSARDGGINLKPEDLRIYDEIHESKMCAGLIIDSSGSMQGKKIIAAIGTSLALAELIRREPKDMLKVYLFSSKVKEIPYYDICNITRCHDSTDIRCALRAFRKGVVNQEGDKQAYLITDAEANTEDGRSVGFEEATSNVLKEVMQYRQAGITLNIIMLDANSQLKEVAATFARRNLGRVIFSSPDKLGEAVIKDYLMSKKAYYAR